MGAKSHIGFWLCAFVVLFFMTPIMRNGPSMEQFVSRELQLTRATFGQRTGDWLEARAGAVYSLYTPAASLRSAAIEGEGMARTRRVVAGPGVAATVAYNSYVQGLVLNVFVAVLRFFIFLVWLAILLPVFCAAVIDGFVQRAIKRAEFGAIRPAANSLSRLLVIPLAMGPLLYLVLPLPVSPLISPVWALVMVLPLSIMVSNMQPVFGRN